MPIKTPQVVSPLPLPPNPADRSTFNTRAYPWSEALAPWTDQVNQLGADTLENAQSAQSDASSASSNAGFAAGYASSASTDAGLALGYKDAAYGSQQEAAGSASTASTASSQAQTARDLARQWASDTTVVADGLKGARGYAQDAAQSAAEAASVILGQVFDDAIESSSFGWTSSKIVSWFNGLTTAFTRTILGRSTAQEVRDDLQLTYPATAQTVGDGVEVMRSGAYGLGNASVLSTTYPSDVYNGAQAVHYYNPGVPGPLGVGYSDRTSYLEMHCSNHRTTIVSDGDSLYFSWIYGRVPVAGDFKKLWDSNNLLNIGTTAATARTALNLFADASGVMTNGPGQLSNDMSNFLSSMTFDDMAQKVGAGSAPRPTKDHGNVAVTGSQTVTCNVLESDFHMMSMGSSDAAGTLTIDFSNMPDTLGKHFSWHVRLQRGARKTVAFAQTINWAGGVAPTFGGSASSYDLMMFYKVGSETIRGMVIDAW